MSCKTCGHPQQHLDDTWRWCARCGTVESATGTSSTPKLVLRCREYETVLGTMPTTHLSSHWQRLGIHEAITPKERPA